MPQPITIRAAGPAEAEAIWWLTVEAYRPDRERLHPRSGVFRETVQTCSAPWTRARSRWPGAEQPS